MDGPSRGGLWNKVAVVTGGGSGLGRAVAKAMARQGASLVVADFDTPRMDRTVSEILKLGKNYHGPAIVTEYSATTVIPSGKRFHLDPASSLIVTIR